MSVKFQPALARVAGNVLRFGPSCAIRPIVARPATARRNCVRGKGSRVCCVSEKDYPAAIAPTTSDRGRSGFRSPCQLWSVRKCLRWHRSSWRRTENTLRGLHCPLRSPHLRFRPLAIFRDTRLQPFLDQAKYPAISHAVLHELNCPFVRQIAEGSHDTLPIISTSLRRSPLSALAILSTADPLTLSRGRTARVDCFLF